MSMLHALHRTGGEFQYRRRATADCWCKRTAYIYNSRFVIEVSHSTWSYVSHTDVGIKNSITKIPLNYKLIVQSNSKQFNWATDKIASLARFSSICVGLQPTGISYGEATSGWARHEVGLDVHIKFCDIGQSFLGLFTPSLCGGRLYDDKYAVAHDISETLYYML